jgi:hypothetical protein
MLPSRFPAAKSWEARWGENRDKSLILLVGAPGFEPGTPSPPDWCANRAALRSAHRGHLYAVHPRPCKGTLNRTGTAWMLLLPRATVRYSQSCKPV